MKIAYCVLLFAFSLCVLFAAGCDEEDDTHALCAEHYEQSNAGNCTGGWDEEQFMKKCEEWMNDTSGDCSGVYEKAVQCDIDNDEVCSEYANECEDEWSDWIFC